MFQWTRHQMKANYNIFCNIQHLTKYLLYFLYICFFNKKRCQDKQRQQLYNIKINKDLHKIKNDLINFSIWCVPFFALMTLHMN